MSASETVILDRLAEIFPPNGTATRLGVGDDCAVVEPPPPGTLLLLAVDHIVSGIHFARESTPPGKAGAKLLKRNLSDIAAMGGKPRHALIAFASSGVDADWILAFHKGVAEEAARHGMDVVGGDLSSSGAEGAVVASLTIVGEVEEGRQVRRRGAKPGDAVVCTGAFGGSFHSGRHLDFSPRIAEGRRLALLGPPTAMMDVSDGLLLDLSRLAKASAVSIRLDPSKVPLHADAVLPSALSEGEDYELIFTIDSKRLVDIQAAWPRDFAPLTVIGAVESGQPGLVEGMDAFPAAFPRLGHEHRL